jgi:uncharacterized protein YjbI with pentapeptide repeats
MANSEHLVQLQQGVGHWNHWREKHSEIVPDLTEAHLTGALLVGADLSEANLSRAILDEANLSRAILVEANLSGAHLTRAHFTDAALSRANLSGAHLVEADLRDANLPEANLARAKLCGAYLTSAHLHRAHLVEAILRDAHLARSDLTWANLNAANLSRAILVNTVLNGTNLVSCDVYGISVWNVNLEEAIQSNLRITPPNEPSIEVDNLEVAQFVYLLLNNERIRNVIDTIGKKGVLLLGRFTGGRMAILEKLRNELRNRGFVPMVFNFDKPVTKDFTDTVRLLTGLSHFVIGDITNPRSAPLELQAVVPEYMIPFVPILEKGEEPFAMFRDLWIKHREWVLDPIRYSSIDRLVEVLDTEVIKPAEARFNALLARKAEELKVKEV